MATERRQMMNVKTKAPVKSAVAAKGAAHAAKPQAATPAKTGSKPSNTKPGPGKAGSNGKSVTKPQAHTMTTGGAVTAVATAAQGVPKAGAAKSQPPKPAMPKSTTEGSKPAAPTQKTAPLTKPVSTVASKHAPPTAAEKQPSVAELKPKPTATVAIPRPTAPQTAKVSAPTGTKSAPTGTKPSTQQSAAKAAASGPPVSVTLAPRVEITAPIIETVRPPRVRQPGDYALEEQVGFQLRRAHQRATTIFNDIMAQFDVTPTQFAALAKIDDEGPVSQNHLGRLTSMDPSTILGVVGRLVRQGFVQLRSTPGDARLTLIELTPDGQRKVVEMKALAAQVTRKTLKPLSPAEAKTLTDLLSRIG